MNEPTYVPTPTPESGISFCGDRRALTALATVMLGVFALVVALTFPDAYGGPLQAFDPPLGVFLIAVLGWVLLALGRRLVNARKPLIVLDGSGFHDRRQLAAPIPWPDIVGIGVGIKPYLVRLTLRGDRAKSLERTGIYRFLGQASSIPANAIEVSLFGVDVSPRDFALHALALSARHGSILTWQGEETEPRLGHSGSPRRG